MTILYGIDIFQIFRYNFYILRGKLPLTHEKGSVPVRITEDSRVRYAGMAVLFLALLGLCWLFPVTGDDWFREDLGLQLGGLGDLMNKVVEQWETTNGRILGNILAYSAGGRKLLRELMRSLITFGVVYMTARVSGSKSLKGLLISFAAVLALPREMFRQIYPWAAGYFNYVPPVLTLLTALWLVRDVFNGEPVPKGAWRALALFALGFVSQLFMENYTVCALFMAAVLLVWDWIKQRRPSPALLCFFAGTVAGAALLFLSPSYGIVMTDTGAYKTGLVNGLSGLIATARENQREVLTYFISGCPVLFLSFTALGIILFARIKKAWHDYVAAAALLAGCAYFAVNCYTAILPALNPIVAAAWGLALLWGCWRWIPDRGRKYQALFLIVSAAVSAFPLLFVQPIGPRCLYLSYVFLLVAAGNMLVALPLYKLPGAVRWVVPSLLAAAVIVWVAYVYLPVHSAETQRVELIEEAMDAGEREVELPTYPNGSWLWEPDPEKVEYRYYYETPGDLSVTYVPLEKWEAENG